MVVPFDRGHVAESATLQTPFGAGREPQVHGTLFYDRSDETPGVARAAGPTARVRAERRRRRRWQFVANGEGVRGGGRCRLGQVDALRLASRQRVNLVELTLVRAAGIVLLKAPRGGAQNFEWAPRLVGVVLGLPFWVQSRTGSCGVNWRVDLGWLRQHHHSKRSR